MDKITSFITGRRRTRSSTSEASTSSSRRHSVAESPQDMDIEEDHPAPRGDMLLLGGMTNPRSASMRFTEGVPPPPRRTTRSSAPPPYKPKKCSYGFTVTSKEEEERLKLMKGRLRPNFDFDEDDMEKLGFHHDIHKLLDNIGWRYFSDGVSVDMQEDIAMEMFMTMKTIMKEVDGEEEAYLKFRLKDEDKEISYTTIGNLLGFRNDANESVQVAAGELDSFWGRIAKDVNRQRRSISNVILQVFHSWMSKRILGRMRESKVTDQELNWMYAALVKKQLIDPTYVMIHRWLCEATTGTGEVGSGCYLTLIARAVNPILVFNNKYLVKGGSIGIEHLKQGHYIGGDEKKGYTVTETNLTLPEPRLRLFGRSDWRDEKLGERVKKTKRGKIIVGSSSTQQEDAEIPPPPPSSAYWREEFRSAPSTNEQGWSSWEGGQEQAWGSTVQPPVYPVQPPVYSAPPYGQYGYVPPYVQVPNPLFGKQYSQLPQPQQSLSIVGAYARRNDEDLAAVLSSSNRIEDGNAGIAYELGRLGLGPPEQFDGGRFQQYYDQGYNTRSNIDEE